MCACAAISQFTSNYDDSSRLIAHIELVQKINNIENVADSDYHLYKSRVIWVFIKKQTATRNLK
jgi:hypothetical protein